MTRVVSHDMMEDLPHCALHDCRATAQKHDLLTKKVSYLNELASKPHNLALAPNMTLKVFLIVSNDI